jgi:hypothetical protein
MDKEKRREEKKALDCCPILLDRAVPWLGYSVPITEISGCRQQQ